MPSSLRRALLGWFGLMITIGLVIFGVVLNLRVREAVLSQADSVIEEHARALAATLSFDLFSGWELDLNKEYLRVITEGGGYAITSRKGEIVLSGGLPLPPVDTLKAGSFARGDYHECIVAGPQGTSVRVGRTIEAESAQLRALLKLTLAVGTGLVLAALLGGWWLATRTLRPIEQMSLVAGRISASDLSQRIARESQPEELHNLAATLNETFERLESAFERQNRFTADVSHELRTPLSVIQSQLELALRKERTPAEYRHSIEACLRSTQRMSRIVEQMLAFARIDSGRGIPAADIVSLDSVLREAVDDAGAAARSAGVELHADVDPVQVRGDPTQLAEMVSNLLTNSIRYNHPGGRVDISLGQEHDKALLRVTDTGMGIPEKALPYIFDRFFQVDPARSRTDGGAGLGLALTQRIVKAHDGQIVAESRLGVGSTFTVTLPVFQVVTASPGE